MDKIIEDLSPYIHKHSLLETPCMMGVDEAGRGPVLGPLVYASCFCPLNKKDEIAHMNFADSKILTSGKREELFQMIHDSEWINYFTVIISAEKLSNFMLQKSPYNLNFISFDAVKTLINGVSQHVNLQEVFVDTIGDYNKLQALLSNTFQTIKFTVRPKADSLYPIVSASSIVAKVTRDKALCCCDPNNSLGSGYPGDPTTIQYLHDHCQQIFGLPSWTRHSWATVKNLYKDKCIKMDWDEKENKDQKQLSDYFKNNLNNRCSYFQKRSMQYIDDNNRF